MWIRGLIIVLCLCYLKGCKRHTLAWVGYVDASVLTIKTPEQGYAEIFVSEGDWVYPGQLLAYIRYTQSHLKRASSRAHIQAHINTLHNMLLQHSHEHAQSLEGLASAYIEAERAEQHWQRMSALLDDKAISTEAFEQAEAQWAQAQSAVRAAEAAYRYADTQDAYEAERYTIYAALAELSAQEQSEHDRYIYAPNEGYIAKKHVQNGAWMTQNSSLFSLGILPYYAVFYVHPKEAARLTHGDTVQIQSATGQQSAARISYISMRPVFTPPIVYSAGDIEEYRFRVEASMDDRSFPVGQPVDILWSAE